MPPDINITIRRQKRRNIMMRTVPGGLEVYIPHWMKPESKEVQAFIKKGIAKLGDKVRDIPDEKTTPQTILDITAAWATTMGVHPTRVQLRDMTRKWGSCSSRGTVTLNKRLCWLEVDLVEYVVVHELAHLIELNHSKKFWAIVQQYLPDYEHRKTELDRVSRELW
ncbi:MAG: M48 family metallopeptidase [Aggregatilineales bacterium]